MLEHITLETRLIDDPRIQALIDDFGLAGLGTYLLLRTQIDAQSDQGLPLDYLLKRSTPYIRKGKLLPILRNYGLFTENDFGIVRTCALAPALAPPAHATPAQPTPARHTPEENKNNFLNNIIGKTTNNAFDIGLREILPDLIENQIIDIKNALLENGLKSGIDTAIKSVIDFRKSATGIITGNFENIGQVRTAIGDGGIIDTIST